jgi:hypothetical protein
MRGPRIRYNEVPDMHKFKFPLSAIAFLVIAPLISQAAAPSSKTNGHWPVGGYVPDAVTAVKIAEAVLIPVFGDQQVLSDRPFTAKLEGDVWTVSGTLHCADGNVVVCKGGTATVKLSKKDAHILFMIHSK